MRITLFKNIYRLIAVDLCKQKALDTDPRSIQLIVLQGLAGEMMTFLRRNSKSLVELKYKWLNTIN